MVRGTPERLRRCGVRLTMTVGLMKAARATFGGMRLPIRILVPCVLLSACAPKLARTWSAPDVGELRFNKLAVVGLTDQEAYRIQAEDAIVEVLTVNAVASHTLQPEHTALRDTVRMVEAFRKAGCDGVVTLELKNQTVRTVAPAPDDTDALTEHLDDYWAEPSEQGTMDFASGQRMAVEVHVFDLKAGRMVYNTLAVETGAKDAADLVRRVREDVVRDLRKRGLVPGG